MQGLTEIGRDDTVVAKLCHQMDQTHPAQADTSLHRRLLLKSGEEGVVFRLRRVDGVTHEGQTADDEADNGKQPMRNEPRRHVVDDVG